MKKIKFIFLIFLISLFTTQVQATDDTDVANVDKECIVHLKDYNNFKIGIYSKEVKISDDINYISCNTPPEINLNQTTLDTDRTFELQKNNPRVNIDKLRKYIKNARDLEDSSIDNSNIKVVGFETKLTNKEKEYCNTINNERPCLTQDLLDSLETLDEMGNVTDALITEKNIYNYTVLYKVIDSGTGVIRTNNLIDNEKSLVYQLSNIKVNNINTPLSTYQELKINFNEVEYYYNLIFHSNSDNIFPNKKVTYKKEVGTLPTPSKTGYTFNGWYNGSNLSYSNKTIYSEKRNTDLYAKYTANQYILNFNANGGSVSPFAKTVIYNSKIGSLPIPTRTGYSFTGWYNSPNSGTIILENDIYKQTSNSTVYAHWAPNIYNISFDIRGHGGTTPPSKNVTYNTLVGSLPTLSEHGWSFYNWYTGFDGTGTNINANTNYLYTNNIRVYANWYDNSPVLNNFDNNFTLNYWNYIYGPKDSYDSNCVTDRECFGSSWDYKGMPSLLWAGINVSDTEEGNLNLTYYSNFNTAREYNNIFNNKNHLYTNGYIEKITNNDTGQSIYLTKNTWIDGFNFIKNNGYSSYQVYYVLPDCGDKVLRFNRTIHFAWYAHTIY